VLRHLSEVAIIESVSPEQKRSLKLGLIALVNENGKNWKQALMKYLPDDSSPELIAWAEEVANREWQRIRYANK
jgi:hypothetical protein